MIIPFLLKTTRINTINFHILQCFILSKPLKGINVHTNENFISHLYFIMKVSNYLFILERGLKGTKIMKFHIQVQRYLEAKYIQTFHFASNFDTFF
jgi:hypothetical protein